MQMDVAKIGRNAIKEKAPGNGKVPAAFERSMSVRRSTFQMAPAESAVVLGVDDDALDAGGYGGADDLPGIESGRVELGGFIAYTSVSLAHLT